MEHDVGDVGILRRSLEQQANAVQVLRQVLEGQFATQLRAAGENAVTTADLLSLDEIKASREAAGARLRAALPGRC